MAYDEKLVDRIRDIIARTHDDVEEKRMFGGICFMVNGKMCVGVTKDRLMVRFDPKLNDEIMEKEGVGPMDFTKRVMRGYAFVESGGLADNKSIEYWVSLALDYNQFAKASKKRS